MTAFAFGTPTAFTLTLASLASDAGLLAGRESTWIDFTGCVDHILTGKVTTGTTPTDARQIEVWAVGLLEGTTPAYPDVFDGTDSAETITSAGIKRAICRLVEVIDTNNTSDRVYNWGPRSLVNDVFRGVPVSKYGLFVTHNTGVNLHATGGNHAAYYTPVTLS